MSFSAIGMSPYPSSRAIHATDRYSIHLAPPRGSLDNAHVSNHVSLAVAPMEIAFGQRRRRISDLPTMAGGTTAPQRVPTRTEMLLQRRSQLAEELAKIDEELQALRLSAPLNSMADLGCTPEPTTSASGGFLAHGRALDYIHNLPTEVLQRIFIIARDDHTIQSEPSAPFFVPHSIQSDKWVRAPWNLSQVSSRWRSVAFGYPHLWSYVGLDIGNAPFRYQIPRGHLYLLGLQMSRAAGQNLHVSLKCAAWSKISVFLPVFLTSAYRWKHLKLSTPGWASNELEELIPVRHMFTSLESLHLESMGYTSASSSATSSATSLYDAPHLQSLTANSSTFINLNFPWSQIHKVHLLSRASEPWNASMTSGLDPARVTAFWSDALPASDVREMIIDDPSLEPLLRLSTREPSVIPSLVKLEIRPRAGDILRYITAPQLTTLNLSLDHWDERHLSPLIDFINRSSERCMLAITLELGSNNVDRTRNDGQVCQLQRALWRIEESRNIAANSLATGIIKRALEPCGRMAEFEIRREGGKMTVQCTIDRM